MLHWRSHPPSQLLPIPKASSLRARRRLAKIACGCVLALAWPLAIATLQTVLPETATQAIAQSSTQSSTSALQLKASRVEANSNTGVVTAIGNVRIDYPSRQIFATAAQAQYYSRDQRIVLSGNVDVEQEGNTLRAETVTYLIAEGRFVATPGESAQVEAIYLLPEGDAGTSGQPSTPAPISIPTPPDELPPELGPINVDN